MVVAKGWREGGMGSCYLMDIEFQYCKMKRVLEMEFWMVVMVEQQYI